MCKVLKLTYDVLVKRNHKGSSVEHFHRFLNKATTITMEDRQSNDVFVPPAIAAGYTRISVHIDGTNILRSPIAIGWEFRFPIVIDLSDLPQLTHNNAQSAVDFLRLTDSNCRFSFFILKVWIEDRRVAHAERVNSNKNIVELVVDDIVIARTAFQSNASTNKVAKLIYQVRGSFRIVTCSGRGSYLVRKLYKPYSPELKFMTADLYPLPSSLKPYEPVDSFDTRYLNQSYSPIVNPLSKPLNIKFYNETWFDKSPRTSKPSFDYDHPTLAFPECPLILFPLLSDLHDELRTPCAPSLTWTTLTFCKSSTAKRKKWLSTWTTYNFRCIYTTSSD